MEEKQKLASVPFQLITHTPFRVRFNEVDPLGIMWHGHYFKIFEDGREEFGRNFGLSYLDIFNEGYVAPVIDIHCDYKKSLQYGDTGFVETKFINQLAAKLVFHYRMYFADSKATIATGISSQVFLHADTRELQLVAPPFFAEWKQQMKLTP